MMADNAILSAYLVMAIVMQSRVAFAAFFAFVFAYALGFIGGSLDAWAYHCVMASIYAVLTYCVGRLDIKKCAMLVVVFQYIMAWDGFLFSHYETYLFHVYPTVSFALNLLLIFTIAKSGSDKIGCNDHTFTDWLSHIQSVATHQKRMRKG